jgi:hypothetical protein
MKMISIGKLRLLGAVVAALALWLAAAAPATYAFPVDPLPDDNLLANPWFRAGSRPIESSLDGWTNPAGEGVYWSTSHKIANPSPDIVISGKCGQEEVYCGTAARLALTPGQSGGMGQSGVDCYLFQVVAADPTARKLKFFTHWVSHRVDVAAVTIYGGEAAAGPWTPVWVPLSHTQTTLPPLPPGGQSELWVSTGFKEVVVENGYPYYKVEIHARLAEVYEGPGGDGTGFKITGMYFAVEASDEAGLAAPVFEPTTTPFPVSGGGAIVRPTDEAADPGGFPEEELEAEASAPATAEGGTPAATAESGGLAATAVAEAPGASGMVLQGTAVSATAIELSWIVDNPNNFRLRLERSEDGAGNWETLVRGEPTLAAYSDSGLTPGRAYYYRLRLGRDTYSSVVMVETPGLPAVLAAPVSLQVATLSAGELALRWRDESDDESGFLIERSDDGVNFVQVGQAGPDATGYTDSGLQAYTEYVYRVRAFSEEAASPYSEPASGRTLFAGEEEATRAATDGANAPATPPAASTGAPAGPTDGGPANPSRGPWIYVLLVAGALLASGAWLVVRRIRGGG